MDSENVQDVIFDVAGLNVSTGVARLMFLAIIVIIALIVSRIVTRALRGVFEKTNVPSASIFVNLVRGLVWGFALLSVLQPVFGIEPSGFIAAIGVTSVALSLGLQDTIANVFGGLSLMLSKVIAPGDIILVNGITGEVVDITWRSTTLKQFNGDEEIIPNSVLSKTALTKLAPFQAGEYQLPIMLTKDADLSVVRKEIDEAAQVALGTYYDEAFGALLFIREFNNFGILATVSLHAKPGISPGRARTAVADAIIGRPWLV